MTSTTSNSLLSLQALRFAEGRRSEGTNGGRPQERSDRTGRGGELRGPIGVRTAPVGRPVLSVSTPRAQRERLPGGMLEPTLTVLESVCYNLHSGQGQMLRVAV